MSKLDETKVLELVDEDVARRLHRQERNRRVLIDDTVGACLTAACLVSSIVIGWILWFGP